MLRVFNSDQGDLQPEPKKDRTMKKTPLYIASALLSVLLLSGMAQAKTMEATATPKTTQTMPAKKGMGAGIGLSEAGQKLMHDTMTKQREENKATFEGLTAKQKELDALLKAATFDKAAFLAKDAEIQELHQKMMRARSEAFADIATQLSPEDRAKLAEGRGPHFRMDGKGPHGKGMMKNGMGCASPEDCPMKKMEADTQPASDKAE